MADERITVMDRIRYELHNLSESSNNIKTWLTVLVILCFVSIFFKSWFFFFVSGLLILYLISERNVQRGKVREFLRKNKDIPNRTQIKQMKEDYLNKQQVQ